jgi:ketosteroid isomerase-like protein
MPARNPEDLGQLFAQSMKSGDLDAVLALYEPGASMPNQQGEVRSGADAIRQDIAPLVAMKPDITIQTDKVILADDIALSHSRWSMAGPAPMSGRAVEVARRQPDDSWLYVIDDPFTLGPA